MAMRTGQLLVAACFVMLTAAACGGASGTAAAGSGAVLTTGTTPPATTTTVAPGNPTGVPVPVKPTTAPPAAGGTPSKVPSGQINSSGMTAPPQGVEVSGDGKQLTFTAEQSGCQLITAQATTQTATQVTVLVITTNTSKGNQMCPMIVRVVQVTAQLNAPLGNRTIVFQAVTKHG
jgi:hypothetical protein